jgi:hypothetical protein
MRTAEEVWHERIVQPRELDEHDLAALLQAAPEQAASVTAAARGVAEAG